MELNKFNPLNYINNLPQIRERLEYEEGTYYKFVALVRAKDFKNGKTPILNINERGEIFVRQWFIDSDETFVKYCSDMVNLCTATKARLYYTVDRKSVKKTILTMKKQLDTYIDLLVNNPNAPLSIRKLSKFSASASQMEECSGGKKYWLVDIDVNKLTPNTDPSNFTCLAGCIANAFNCVIFPRTPLVNITPNGLHLIVERNFDLPTKLDKFLQTGDLWVEGISINKEQVSNSREVLLKYKDNYEIKKNALSLAFRKII